MSNEENKLLLDLKESNFNKSDSDENAPVVDVSKVQLILKKSWFISLLILVFCIGASHLYLRYTMRVYESSSVIQLKVENKVDDVGLTIGQGENIQGLSEEIELIRSNIIFDEVIDHLGLELQYVQKGNVLYDERYRDNPFIVQFDSTSLPAFDLQIHITVLSDTEVQVYINDSEKGKNVLFGSLINLDGIVFRLFKTEDFSSEDIKSEFYFIHRSRESLYNEFRTNLLVQIQNVNARTIAISFRDYEPYRAYNIVNAIDSVYLVHTLSSKRQAQQQRLDFIASQLDTASEKLEKQEILLEDFIKNSGTADPTGEFSKVIDGIAELNETKSEILEKVELLQEVEKVIANTDDISSFLPVISGLDDPQLKSYIEQYNTLLSEFNRLKSTINDNTVAYRIKETEMQAVKAGVQESLLRNKRFLFNKVDELNVQIGAMENEFFKLPSKNTALRRIQRYYDLYEKYYLMLVEKRVEFGIAKAGTVPEFVILSPPSSTFNPISPKESLVYIIGIIAGLMLSLLFTGVLYATSNTIISEKELERAVNAPILGSIPRYRSEKLKISRLVVDKNPKSAMSEALRSIRTNIDFINPDYKKVISITSTISGEGKTFVAINLAGILAQGGKKVVLVDLDMRKPKIHLGFDVDNECGMSNLLIGKRKLQNCIKNSGIDGFDFITAGPTPPNPSELILRKEFENLIAELKLHYDVVLIDTPPVGLVTDGVLIMKYADIPMYVVRSQYSKRSVAQNINRLKQVHNFNNISVVLNSVSTGSKYGYGYGYYEDSKS